jgi:hypothetical protein
MSFKPHLLRDSTRFYAPKSLTFALESNAKCRTAYTSLLVESSQTGGGKTPAPAPPRVLNFLRRHVTGPACSVKE